MRQTLQSCLFIITLFITSFASAENLTEESVKNLISRVDNAVNSLNADEIAATMSDNIVIIMNITMQGQKQVLKPSKQEYIALLKQGWAAYQNYKYSKSNMKITLNNNKALVTANVKESMTIQGQNISGSSREEVTIELVNNKPMITAITGYTSM